MPSATFFSDGIAWFDTFKQAAATISFVNTKRNRRHDTQMPSETFFQTALCSTFKASQRRKLIFGPGIARK
jgi:hypothetical protein